MKCVNVLVLSLVVSFSFGQYFPKKGEWLSKIPSDLGVDSLQLQNAVRFAIDAENPAPRDQEEGQRISFGREPFGESIGPYSVREEPTGIIIYKGSVLATWGNTERVDMTHSVTKSFLSTTVGLAWDAGILSDTEELVNKKVGSYQSYPSGKLFFLFDTKHNQKISWEHLLRQTSDWEGTLWGKPEWADRPSKDTLNWMTRERINPGDSFEYNDVRVNVLALSALYLWRKPLPQVLKERLMDKIGASDTWRWYGYENSWVNVDGNLVQSVSGGGHWGGGMFINAWDMARFGYLTLRNGKWNDEQVISKDWLEKARTPTKVNPEYGYMNFFLNTGKKPLPAAPETAYYHLGNGTNMIYCDQENDLLIVARWIQTKTMNGLIEKVLLALPKN